MPENKDESKIDLLIALRLDLVKFLHLERTLGSNEIRIQAILDTIAIFDVSVNHRVNDKYKLNYVKVQDARDLFNNKPKVDTAIEKMLKQQEQEFKEQYLNEPREEDAKE